MTISAALNLPELNLDGSHTIAKKNGTVAYQGRKKAKTTNIFPIHRWSEFHHSHNRFDRWKPQ
jgi:hypothetical protein